MDVIRKVSIILIFVALVSFVGGSADAKHNAKININTASVEQLTTLPGIGRKKAEAIAEHREESGSFATIEDIKSVKGVGDKIFSKIKDQIVTE
jgi:competence protein ComEA